MSTNKPSPLYATTTMQRIPRPPEPPGIVETTIAPLLRHPAHVLNAWVHFVEHNANLYLNPPPQLVHAPRLERLVHVVQSQSYTAKAYLKFCFVGTIDPGDKAAGTGSKAWKGVKDPWAIYPHTEACYNIPWGSVAAFFIMWFIICPLLWLFFWRLGVKKLFWFTIAVTRWAIRVGTRAAASIQAWAREGDTMEGEEHRVGAENPAEET